MKNRIKFMRTKLFNLGRTDKEKFAGNIHFCFETWR